MLNDKPAYFFWDTGSSRSIVSLETLRNFGLSSHITICVNTENTASAIGSTVLNNAIDNKIIAHKFVVESNFTPGHLLLRHDFLCCTWISLHPQSTTTTFNGSAYPLWTPPCLWTYPVLVMAIHNISHKYTYPVFTPYIPHPSPPPKPYTPPPPSFIVSRIRNVRYT